MRAPQDLHREAMSLADEADRRRQAGEEEKSRDLMRQAFELERQAAEQCGGDLEPTRSILHRSAAEMALECGLYREAERLAAAALSGNPPNGIADELRDVLERVYFDVPPSKMRRVLTS